MDLFINNLLEHKDPRNILRQAWSMCEDFYKLTKKVNKEDGDLEKLEREAYENGNIMFRNWEDSIKNEN